MRFVCFVFLKTEMYNKSNTFYFKEALNLLLFSIYVYHSTFM